MHDSKFRKEKHMGVMWPGNKRKEQIAELREEVAKLRGGPAGMEGSTT